MKRKYMKPFTEVVIVNHENLLFDDWHSTQLHGTLPDGTEVGNGGDGEEDDIEVKKVFGTTPIILRNGIVIKMADIALLMQEDVPITTHPLVFMPLLS